VREIEFAVPSDARLQSAEQLIETVCSQQGLRVAMKGSLSTYPGCIHWHYKNGDQKGTLELTLYLPERRIWAKIQDGRKAPWIDDLLPSLQKAVEMKLRSQSPSGRNARIPKGK
jgi:GT2 family glycosyltransferase